jgi:formate dehydrogenase maturation protein FdhE
MKNIYIIIILSLLTITNGSAQERTGKKIEQAKIAILSTKLNLTEQQSIKFWPIYNQYLSEMKTIQQNRKAANDGLDNIETASDTEIEKNLNLLLQSQEDELSLSKKYRTEFARVLNIRQMALLIRAEKEFKEMLLRKIGAQQGIGKQGGAFRNRMGR